MLRQSSIEPYECPVDQSPLEFFDQRIKGFCCKPFAYVLSYLFHAQQCRLHLG